MNMDNKINAHFKLALDYASIRGSLFAMRGSQAICKQCVGTCLFKIDLSTLWSRLGTLKNRSNFYYDFYYEFFLVEKIIYTLP